jgi:short-subunit dehydrogenase
MANGRPLAVVTGASSGIGLELARCCAKNGFALLVVADEPEIQNAAELLKTNGGSVEALEADLATVEGVDELYKAIGGRPVSALLANAGRGLGKGFLDQDFDDIVRVALGQKLTTVIQPFAHRLNVDQCF